jgi:hypothetical protein
MDLQYKEDFKEYELNAILIRQLEGLVIYSDGKFHADVTSLFVIKKVIELYNINEIRLYNTFYPHKIRLASKDSNKLKFYFYLDDSIVLISNHAINERKLSRKGLSSFQEIGKTIDGSLVLEKGTMLVCT